MPDPTDRLARAFALIDGANAADPEIVTVGGRDHPRQVLYALRMTAWLDRLAPGAPEALRLAVRCQHLCRWEIPRARFPATRGGYLRWRSALARFHAERAGAILAEAGYEPDTIRRVQELVQKKGLGGDPATQLLEDCACLVFLEHELETFAPRHEPAKLIGILRKTWRKMSPEARDRALALDLRDAHRALLQRALA